MKKSFTGTSIVESMIVLLIVVIWIVWTYLIFTSSLKLSQTSQNRIIATQIAREWIEAIMNIRDTNWILFWANINNCWMTSNYNSNCITTANTHFSSWSYILYPWNDDRWYLSWITTSFTWFSVGYRNTFWLSESWWLYTQSGWTITSNPFYTREIKLIAIGSNPPQNYKIESIVKWTDSSRNNWNFEIKLENELTNWKK